MVENKENISFLKANVRSLLLTLGKYATEREFRKEYLEREGCDFNVELRKYGFRSFQDLFMRMPDVCSVSHVRGEVVLARISGKESSHLDKVTVNKYSKNYRGPKISRAAVAVSSIQTRSINRNYPSYYNPIHDRSIQTNSNYPSYYNPIHDRSMQTNTSYQNQSNQAAHQNYSNQAAYQNQLNQAAHQNQSNQAQPRQIPNPFYSNIQVTTNANANQRLVQAVNRIQNVHRVQPVVSTTVQNIVQPISSISSRLQNAIAPSSNTNPFLSSIKSQSSKENDSIQTVKRSNSPVENKPVKDKSENKITAVKEEPKIIKKEISNELKPTTLTNGYDNNTSSASSTKASVSGTIVKPLKYKLEELETTFNQTLNFSESEGGDDDEPATSEEEVSSIKLSPIEIKLKARRSMKLFNNALIAIRKQSDASTEQTSVKLPKTFTAKDPIITSEKNFFRIKLLDLSNPSNFSFQFSFDELKKMMEKIQHHYNKISDIQKLKVQKCVNGMLVAVKKDDCWYRAEIKSFDDHSAEISLIDYRKVENEEIFLNNIYYLDEEFSQQGRKSGLARLHGVQPKNKSKIWDLRSTLELMPIKNKNLIASVRSYDAKENVYVLAISLNDNPLSRVADLLFHKDLADINHEDFLDTATFHSLI